jgi:hypothetical protein
MQQWKRKKKQIFTRRWSSGIKKKRTPIHKVKTIIQENEMYRELYRQNRVEEEEQRQKSRCLWLKAGDKNTSFFHNNIKLRRAGNQIDKIVAEGKEISDQEEIKEAAFNHFKSFYQQPLSFGQL